MALLGNYASPEYMVPGTQYLCGNTRYFSSAVAQTRESAVKHSGRRHDHRPSHRDEPGAVHRRVGRAAARAYSARGEHGARVGGAPPGVARSRRDRGGPELRADVCQSVAAHQDRQARCAHPDGRVRDGSVASRVSALRGAAPCAGRARGARRARAHADAVYRACQDAGGRAGAAGVPTKSGPVMDGGNVLCRGRGRRTVFFRRTRRRRVTARCERNAADETEDGPETSHLERASSAAWASSSKSYCRCRSRLPTRIVSPSSRYRSDAGSYLGHPGRPRRFGFPVAAN